MEKWRMPDKEELNLMYLNLYKFGVGGFADHSYWSSRKYNAYSAWNQDFLNGYRNYYDKYNCARVRAVRAFVSLEDMEIGDKTSTGIIFDKKGAKFKECKFQDEPEICTWHEAMKLFGK